METDGTIREYHKKIPQKKGEKLKKLEPNELKINIAKKQKTKSIYIN